MNTLIVNLVQSNLTNKMPQWMPKIVKHLQKTHRIYIIRKNGNDFMNSQMKRRALWTFTKRLCKTLSTTRCIFSNQTKKTWTKNSSLMKSIDSLWKENFVKKNEPLVLLLNVSSFLHLAACGFDNEFRWSWNTGRLESRQRQSNSTGSVPQTNSYAQR